jgi:hypothetical protein
LRAAGRKLIAFEADPDDKIMSFARVHERWVDRW